ncbi:MAG: HEAT repeat domain-containing protein [Candidatus Zhuqueibacterota bacterium]
MKHMTRISMAMAVVLMLSVLATGLFAQQADGEKYDKYLIKSLSDENVGIRSSAAQLLGERKVKEAIEPLTRMLKSEKNSSARIVAAMSLYKIGDESVLPLLKKVAANDKNKTVRRVVTAMVYEMEGAQLAKK